MIFLDRRDAGQQLATRLMCLKSEPNLIVLGIPRGGVVVAAEIARSLDAPLDVFIAHKLGAPFNSELAMGAVTSTGEILLDESLIAELRLSEDAIMDEVERQRTEICRRLEMFRPNRPPLDLANKIAVVVDDGVATGSTVLSALRAIRQQKPARLILAVPVGPKETLARLACECNEVVTIATPEPFFAVGRFYYAFEQTTDAEVVALLQTSQPQKQTE